MLDNEAILFSEPPVFLEKMQRKNITGNKI